MFRGQIADKKRDVELQEHQNQSQNLEKITWSSLLASAVDAKPKVFKITDLALNAYSLIPSQKHS